MTRTKTQIYKIEFDITSGVHLGAIDNLAKKPGQKKAHYQTTPFEHKNTPGFNLRRKHREASCPSRNKY